MSDFFFAPLARAARDALFGEPDPWRRRDPRPPVYDPFRQGPTMPFSEWPHSRRLVNPAGPVEAVAVVVVVLMFGFAMGMLL